MKKTLGLFGIKIVSAVLTYAANAIITNYLSVEDAGYYFLFTTIILLFSGVTKLGFDSTAIREVAIYRSKGDSAGIKHFIFNTLALLTVTSIVLSLPLTGIVFFFIKKNSAIALVGITMLFFTLKEVIAAMLKGLQQYYQAGFIQNSSLPIGLIIFFGFCYITKLKADEFLGYLFCVVLCISAGLIFLYKNKVLPKINLSSFSVKQSFKLIDYNYYMLGLFLLAINWLPNVIVGAFLKVEDVAIFNVMNRTAIIISFIYIAVEGYIAPKIAHHFEKKEDKEIQILLSKVSKLSFAISTVVVAAALITSKFCLKLFGPVYAKNYLLFDILAVAQYINVLTGSGATFLSFTRRQKIVRNVYFITMLLIAIIMPIISSLTGLFYTTVAYALIIIGYNLTLTIIARVKFKTRVSFLVP